MQVLALAQELARAQGEIQRLTVEQQALPEVLRQLADLSTRLEQLHNGGEATEPVWDWTSMDRECARSAWLTLHAWVNDILGEVYKVLGEDAYSRQGRIPLCWYQHRELVIDLSWLCQEWRRIYATPGATPAHAGDWHERHLPGVLARAKNGDAAGCTSGHKDYATANPAVGFEEAMHADLGRRT